MTGHSDCTSVMTQRPKFTVLEVLLEEYGDPRWRTPDRALKQLVNDWYSFPETRSGLLASSPPEDAVWGHITKISAVVHALCVHNDLEPPSWVHDYCSDSDVWLFGVQPWMGTAQIIKQNSHPVCKKHKVWFKPEFVIPKSELLVNPFADMSIEEFSDMLGIEAYVGRRSELAGKCLIQ